MNKTKKISRMWVACRPDALLVLAANKADTNTRREVGRKRDRAIHATTNPVGTVTEERLPDMTGMVAATNATTKAIRDAGESFAAAAQAISDLTDKAGIDYNEAEALARMTVKELKLHCKAHGITGYSDMPKSELIRVIMDHNKENSNA